MPVFLGEKLSASCRDATAYHSAKDKFAIRKGDWVLIDAPTGDDNGAHGEPKWLKDERRTTQHSHRGELFDVRENLAERYNHFADRPELVIEFKALLENYMREGRSTSGAAQQNDTQIQPFSP